jgi:hypothetical protein
MNEQTQEMVLQDARREIVPSPLGMMQAVIDKGVTPDNMVALEKLVDLYERMQDRDAEKAFNAAFVGLQQEMPTIVATTEIPNRGKYERFEDVMRVVGPLLAKHNFSVSFSMDVKENRVVETCHLRHAGGHSQSNSFAVRTGKADSETQADCKAATTAKRNALLNCLNIVIRQDVYQAEEGDASLEGSVLPFEKVQYLREQVAEVGFKEANFLALAGVDAYEKITSGKYSVLVNAIEMKRRARA